VHATTVANPASAALFMKRRRPGTLSASSCCVDGDCWCLVIIDPCIDSSIGFHKAGRKDAGSHLRSDLLGKSHLRLAGSRSN
jgi:hypothetical protein